MKFTIKYSFDTETKQYIAEIPEFHLSDFGETIDDAERNVKMALSLYIEETMTGSDKTDHKQIQYA